MLQFFAGFCFAILVSHFGHRGLSDNIENNKNDKVSLRPVANGQKYLAAAGFVWTANDHLDKRGTGVAPPGLLFTPGDKTINTFITWPVKWVVGACHLFPGHYFNHPRHCQTNSHLGLLLCNTSSVIINKPPVLFLVACLITFVSSILYISVHVKLVVNLLFIDS